VVNLEASDLGSIAEWQLLARIPLDLPVRYGKVYDHLDRLQDPRRGENLSPLAISLKRRNP
jgi:hypothetical protein